MSVPVSRMFCATVVGLLAATFVACGGPDAGTPAEAVESYLSALADGDAETACELLGPDAADSDFAPACETDEPSVPSDEQELADTAEVGSVEEEGGTASVDVAFGDTQVSLDLAKDGDEWRINGIADVPGGLFDALGAGAGASDSELDQQVEAAEAQLAEDPKDEQALLELARAHFLAGQSLLEQDPDTAQPTLTDESRQEFLDATRAWDDYVAVASGPPDESVAQLAAEAYVLLEDAEGAAAAQRIVADASPSAASLARLAVYLYAAGEFEAGDEAAEEAGSKATPSERKQLNEYLAQVRKQAKSWADVLESPDSGEPTTVTP